MKSLVYDTWVDSEQALIAIIAVAVDGISDNPLGWLLESIAHYLVYEGMHYRLTVNKRHFEPILSMIDITVQLQFKY